MLHVATFMVLFGLGVCWAKGSLLDLSIKVTLILLSMWHLFVIFNTSGYIVRIPH